MAVKTFTTGEVLTAADTNTYLNNGGLVYIKSQTVGSAVSSVTVSNAFSSTYDNYFVTWQGTASSTANIYLKLGSTDTGYYGTIIYSLPNAPTPTGLGMNNAVYWQYIGDCTSNGGRLACTIIAPNLAQRSGVNALYMGTGTAAGAFGVATGNLDNATQYTAFTFGPTAGTITGGDVTVYGYRKA